MNKQIIDVTQCPYYKEDKTCTYLPFESKCEGDCNWTAYKEMEEQLKAKEQEYERLSSLIRKTQTYKDTCYSCRDDILLYSSISERTNYTQIEVEERSLERIIQQLDQLKAENETYKKIWRDEDVQLALNEVRTGERHLWFNKTEEYKQTLTEIKEIAEEVYDDEETQYQASGICYEILQKISEVLDEKII